MVFHCTIHTHCKDNEISTACRDDLGTDLTYVHQVNQEDTTYFFDTAVTVHIVHTLHFFTCVPGIFVIHLTRGDFFF